MGVPATQAPPQLTLEQMTATAVYNAMMRAFHPRAPDDGCEPTLDEVIRTCAALVSFMTEVESSALTVSQWREQVEHLRLVWTHPRESD